jgi:hypothetical protein
LIEPVIVEIISVHLLSSKRFNTDRGRAATPFREAHRVMEANEAATERWWLSGADRRSIWEHEGARHDSSRQRDLLQFKAALDGTTEGKFS